jgi:hypothetical protein
MKLKQFRSFRFCSWCVAPPQIIRPKNFNTFANSEQKRYNLPRRHESYLLLKLPIANTLCDDVSARTPSAVPRNKMEPFPEDWQLLSFFECEPEVLSDGVPWAYNTLTFHTQRDSDDIQCRIEPGYETFHLVWTRNNCEFLNLKFHWIRSIQIETGDGTEVLRAEFRDDHVLPFVLRLKPTVHVLWGTDSMP